MKKVLWVGIRESDLPKLTPAQQERIGQLAERPEKRRVRVRGSGHHRVIVQMLHLKSIDGPIGGPTPILPFVAIGARIADVPINFRRTEDFIGALEKEDQNLYRRQSQVALSVLQEIFGQEIIERVGGGGIAQLAT